MTNADKIRAMSDEKLSEFMFDIACYIGSFSANASKDMVEKYRGKFNFHEFVEERRQHEIKRDSMLTWLKQEAE